MVGVATDMRLEQNRFAFSSNAAAIDEVLRNVPDFGDMGVCRDPLAAGQHKTRKLFGRLFERCPQIGKFHV